MTDGTYSVSLLALESAVISAGETSANIAKLLGELDTHVQGKLATWTGDAQLAYKAAKDLWDAAKERMPTSLAAARTTLENIAEQYDAAEKAAIDMFFDAR
ncbi:WXG100 family type VII secretion target [Actinophytocola sp.]|jgi:ESAT-6 family protein|uniref:WXG100 family type VII secretion target n=1 Tax=Actinophytocola sp. TaxID=1872138 RepID=UPI002D3770E5|nr:WXG100 family type VII secretion target [Actinophytocola sp.]HYQ64008.1 WXG100 family type VII secretion target [Actinophytocola sp.]